MKQFSELTKLQQVLVEVLGWLGMALLLLAYCLITYGFVDAQTAWWQLLNFTGSVGIVINSYTKRAMPSVWLNLIFAFVALSGIYQILRG